jgi:transcriptional regulator with XRE-family HTH domain
MESTPGKRLLEWREYKGITLAEMARITGVSKSTINTVEQSGSSNPSYDTITKVLGSFPDLSPDWLLLGNGPMLRGGRELTPAPTVAAEPAPRYTSAEETVEEANTLIKLAETEADNRQLRQRLEDAREEILWLRGKSYPSSYAAAPEQPRMEIRRWGEVTALAQEAQGKHFILETNGECSEAEAA